MAKKLGRDRLDLNPHVIAARAGRQMKADMEKHQHENAVADWNAAVQKWGVPPGRKYPEKPRR
jgi:uncharacterized protein YijF (DUF1287 family)